MTRADILRELGERYPALLPVLDSVDALCALLCETFRRGGKLLVAGNGGSLGLFCYAGQAEFTDIEMKTR